MTLDLGYYFVLAWAVPLDCWTIREQSTIAVAAVVPRHQSHSVPELTWPISEREWQYDWASSALESVSS